MLKCLCGNLGTQLFIIHIISRFIFNMLLHIYILHNTLLTTISASTGLRFPSMPWSHLRKDRNSGGSSGKHKNSGSSNSNRNSSGSSGGGTFTSITANNTTTNTTTNTSTRDSSESADTNTSINVRHSSEEHTDDAHISNVRQIGSDHTHQAHIGVVHRLSQEEGSDLDDEDVLGEGGKLELCIIGVMD